MGTDRILTSPDGINWTARSSDDHSYTSVCFAENQTLFVATCTSLGGNFPGVVTSPDGINWTSRSIAVDNLRSVCYSEDLGLFVAVGQGQCAYSKDGITWRVRDMPTSIGYVSVCYAENITKFVAVSFGVVSSSL